MSDAKQSTTRDSQPSTQWKFWREARVMELEPYYCYWVSHLTSEGLHDKADIATVLAILHQQRDDMQADAMRLHREKMDALYGPDGFPRSHVAPLRSHHGKVIEVSQSTDTAPSSTRERTPFEIGKAIADKLAEPLPLVNTLQALQSDADGSYSLRISEAVRQEIVDALYAVKPSHVAPLDQVSAIRKQAFLDAEAICIQVRDRAVMSKFATRDHCTEYRSAAWECACSLRAMADAAPANVAPINAAPQSGEETYATESP